MYLSKKIVWSQKCVYHESRINYWAVFRLGSWLLKKHAPGQLLWLYFCDASSTTWNYSMICFRANLREKHLAKLQLFRTFSSLSLMDVFVGWTFDPLKGCFAETVSENFPCRWLGWLYKMNGQEVIFIQNWCWIFVEKFLFLMVWHFKKTMLAGSPRVNVPSVALRCGILKKRFFLREIFMDVWIDKHLKRFLYTHVGINQEFKYQMFICICMHLSYLK